MEAFGGTGDFSAGLPAPETRKGKLVSDRCHGELAGEGRVMSSLHGNRVASSRLDGVACAASSRGAILYCGVVCCSDRRSTADRTHTVRLTAGAVQGAGQRAEGTEWAGWRGVDSRAWVGA